MHDIKASDRRGNDIMVSFEVDGRNQYEAFSYQDLIDQRINAFDLLDRPMAYRIDREAHTIVSRK